MKILDSFHCYSIYFSTILFYDLKFNIRVIIIQCIHVYKFWNCLSLNKVIAINDWILID